MRHYNGNEKVGPGIYLNVKELVFRSIEEEATLDGGAKATWYKVPTVAMLLAGPVLGLAYAMFLPFIGFVMLAGVTFGWVGKQLQPAFFGATRALRPAWQPALAFLGRGKAAKPAETKKKDAWAEEVRKDVAEPVKDEEPK